MAGVVPGLGDTAATASDRAVTLQWRPVTDVGLRGYEVWRAVPGMPYVRRVATRATATTYVDKNLTNGWRDHYVVRAIDTAGNRAAPSSATSAVPFDDAAPTIPTPWGVVGDGQLTIKWRAAKDSTAVASYRLYGATGDASFGAPVTLGADTLSYVHTGLTNGTPYRDAVSAVDTLGHVGAVAAKGRGTQRPHRAGCRERSSAAHVQPVRAGAGQLHVRRAAGGHATQHRSRLQRGQRDRLVASRRRRRRHDEIGMTR